MASTLDDGRQDSEKEKASPAGCLTERYLIKYCGVPGVVILVIDLSSEKISGYPSGLLPCQDSWECFIRVRYLPPARQQNYPRPDFNKDSVLAM